ncbi:MAG: ABC transporter permease [Rhodothermales bacterium]
MHQHEHRTPPRLAAAILGWLLREHTDTALGDYEEYFNEIAAASGVARARWWYRGQVVRLIPDRLFEKAFWNGVMLKNYLVLGGRNLKKNRLASTINLVGLAAAIACTITLFLLMQVIGELDGFHENGDLIYLVGHTVEQTDGTRRLGTAPVALGPVLAADFPQIARSVRFTETSAQVRSNGTAFQETIGFADAGFFELLTFPLAEGSPAALTEPNAIIISAEMARKYFRGRDAMGQALEITFEGGRSEMLVVKGIAEPFPTSARFTFDFLVGFDHRDAYGAGGETDWARFSDATFIQIPEPDDAPAIEAQLNRYIDRQHQANPAWQVQSYFLDNINHPDLIRAWETEHRAIIAPPIWEMAGIGLVGVLVLLISCINYITISLGSAARRLKEIGIRKTSGAEKRQLVAQFLAENLVLCFLALVAGAFLAATVLIPYMNGLIAMQVRIDVLHNAGFWVLMAGLLAFIALVSGAYPAFYISSFQPVEILRGKQKLAEKKGLNRVLTTTQFVLTIMTICVAFIITSLDDTLTGGDWGYDEEALLVVPQLNPEQFTRMANDLAQIASIQQIAGATDHIGASRNTISVSVNGEESEALYYRVGPSYLATMGVRLVSGRLFEDTFAADSATSVVVNRTLARQQGWADPVGQQVRFDERAYTVVGMVDDVLIHPLGGTAQPVLFGLSESDRPEFMVLRVDPGERGRVAGMLRERWEQQFPEVAFSYYPQTAVFEEFDFMIRVFSRFIGSIAAFALFISCMGLFGVASQRATLRIKEVGIRKAMGASATQIVFLVNRGFLVMLAIATLIATPICYAGMSLFVSVAPVDIPLDPAPFVWTNALVFLLAGLTLSMQTRALVRVNPAHVLLYG